MNDGLAALIAAGFGLLGALSAAAAALWGARTGAAKVLEAAKAQVAGQELAEHRHWAREQRMLTLMATVDQLTSMDAALSLAWVKLIMGEVPDGDLHEQFSAPSKALMSCVFRLGVWGPSEGRVVGHEIHRLANRVHEVWILWEGALHSGNPTDALQEDFRVRRAALNGPWAEFLNIAGRALKEPEQAS
ncbi:hypothetical protein [Streptomyces bobili]|uniref:hypothetical protein n=1 Tax=Streptomyces bobili TaxID=67280 RepID=UPI0037221E4F